MRKSFVALSLLLACALAAAGQSVLEWITFDAPQGRFTVELPAAPTSDVKTAQDAKAGPYTTHLFMARGGGEIYIVGWVDYDPNFNFGVQAELEANRDKFVAGAKARLIESKPIRFGPHPGLEFTAEIEGENPAQIRSRVYVVGRRPYQLIAVSAKGRDATRNFTRFFSSFKLKSGA